MPTAQQQARLRALEAATEHRAHVGVLWYAHRDDVPRLLAEAAHAGRVAPGYGLILLPAPLESDDWAARAEAQRMRC